MRLLIIEDDESLAGYVARGLREAGHTAVLSADGQEGLRLATASEFDVLVVDRMLPGLDGLSLVKTLRATPGPISGVPILFLTALGDVEHRVEGLNAGADDYLAKPFHFSELLARVTALHRRQAREAPVNVLKVADLELDLMSREARRGDKPIELQPREFQLLRFLMQHSGQVVTRTMLLEKVWDIHFDPQTNVIDVHVSRLRNKVDKGFEPLIQTVRGAGYMLREPATEG